jgi:RimJ/RimL family protein N-acetyltransferase
VSWLADFLLESPVPPAVWLPSPSERRSRARLVVEAILKRRPPHRGWHPGHRLRADLGSPFGSFGRSVPGTDIEAEIESVLTHLNPPIFQGWVVLLLVPVAWLLLVVLRAAAPGQELDAMPRAVAALGVGVLAVAVIVLAAGFHQREIEVCQHGIVVRRWTDAWFHRHGMVIGMPEAIRARVREGHLEIDGPGTADVRISLSLWPPSARRDLARDLEALGLRVDRAPEALLSPEGVGMKDQQAAERPGDRDVVPEILTERLLLRAWRRDDDDLFAALNADPEVMRHFPNRLSKAASDRLINAFMDGWREQRFGIWAVERRTDGAFLGFTGLSRPSFEAQFTPAVEVGWRFAREAWGHGYATEAAEAALRFGFEAVGLDEIVSFTVPANERSWRVMERLGMTRDPRDDFDHPRLPRGHPLRRHVLYRLRRADWERAHDA